MVGRYVDGASKIIIGLIVLTYLYRLLAGGRLGERVRHWARRLRRDVHAIYLSARDPRMPWYAKAWALVIAAYAVSPIDLIPDFIPVLGHLDEAILLPLGVMLAVRLIPEEVLEENRRRAEPPRGADRLAHRRAVPARLGDRARLRRPLAAGVHDWRLSPRACRSQSEQQEQSPAAARVDAAGRRCDASSRIPPGGTTMNKKLAGALALAAAIATAPLARAETPASTLVIAMNIDDIISLDPAETFELVGGEVIANVYDRITAYEPGERWRSTGGVAESWDIADDGHTIILHLRPGQTFHSGNPLTAADVVFSLARVIKLDKTPSFIFTQFGWTPENVDQMVTATDDMTVSLTDPGEARADPGAELPRRRRRLGGRPEGRAGARDRTATSATSG